MNIVGILSKKRCLTAVERNKKIFFASKVNQLRKVKTELAILESELSKLNNRVLKENSLKPAANHLERVIANEKGRELTRVIKDSHNYLNKQIIQNKASHLELIEDVNVSYVSLKKINAELLKKNNQLNCLREKIEGDNLIELKTSQPKILLKEKIKDEAELSDLLFDSMGKSTLTNNLQAQIVSSFRSLDTIKISLLKRSFLTSKNKVDRSETVVNCDVLNGTARLEIVSNESGRYVDITTNSNRVFTHLKKAKNKLELELKKEGIVLSGFDLSLL
jgi:hypothetical protein